MKKEEDINLIIKRFQKGEKELFSIIIEKYEKYIYNVLMKFLHSSDDAEDLTQDILIKLYNALDNFKFKSNIKTYIYKMVINQVSDYRKKKREYQLVEEIPDKIYEDKIEEKLFEEEMIKNLEKAILKLPENYKELIYLRDFKQLSYNEIAKKLNITPNAAKIRHYYALKKLRKFILFPD